MTKNWPVTAPGSQGVFRGKGRGLGSGRQATFLSWFRLVQLPGQVLSILYTSEARKIKDLIPWELNKLVYSVLSTVIKIRYAQLVLCAGS
jgi:hypothetical protein